MIRYFEKQLKELDYSIHSLDENIFERWVDEAVKPRKWAQDYCIGTR